MDDPSRKFIDGLITQYFPKRGIFVEIGAYDGETYSKTCHLADHGWHGWYFEPLLEFAYKCKERHKNNHIHVVPVGIGKSGIQKFYKSDLLSTFEGERYQKKVSNLVWFKDRKFVETRVASLSSSMIPQCDLLVIDTEGSELRILKGLKIQPKIIIIELHEKSKEWQKITSKSTQACLSILKDMGYTKVYADDTDSIFIHGI